MDEGQRIAMIHEGIPTELPNHPGLDSSLDHAPLRKQVLSKDEEILAIQNALRYFPKVHHKILAA